MNRGAVKEAINKFAANKGLSKNKLAEKLGISPATLSNIQNEHWNRLHDSMLQKIWNDLKETDWQIVKTVSYQIINQTCDFARARKRMVCIMGDTGTGKTTALIDYYRRNENTYYIRCKKSISSKQFLKLILQEMGVMYDGSTYDISERIASELNKQLSPLLIFDEASKLSQRVLEYIHDLRDMTDANTGIALVGVGYFKTNLEKAVTKNKEGMPEFYDRISMWQELTKPTKHEIHAVCESNGITDKAVIKEMLSSLNFRVLSNYIGNYLYNTVK